LPPFPADAEEPIVEEIEAVTRAIRVSLFGDIEARKLKELSEQIREEILALGNISEISILGERDYEISIELSDDKMRRYGLSFDDIVTAIQARSRDLPGGLLRTDSGAITLRSISQAYAGREFEQLTLISRDDGTRIRVGDVATRARRLRGTAGAEPGRRQAGADLRHRARRRPERSRNHLPGPRLRGAQAGGTARGVSIVAWYDASRDPARAHRPDAAQRRPGRLLVVIALALFLDLSLAFWVVLGLPFAVLGCLATLEIFGLPVSINVLSVFGFILVLGLLVDDAIVTAESAYARLERDGKGLESVVGGVQRVTTATVFGALTTAVAFGPSLFLNEGFARILSQLGYVVILCVIFSLIETKLVLPAHLRHIRVTTARRPDRPVRRAQQRWPAACCLRPRSLPAPPCTWPCSTATRRWRSSSAA
jgi:multidrug efflux pump subunit AcrB